MDSLVLRKMVLADVEEVGRLEEESFSSPWSKEGMVDTLSRGNAILLVAKNQGQILGFACMFTALDEGEITDVIIKKEARNQGVATELMAYLLEEARLLGIVKIALEVRVSNEAAIHLYEKLGFEKMGLRRDFYREPTEDGYIMVWEDRFIPLPNRSQ